MLMRAPESTVLAPTVNIGGINAGIPRSCRGAEIEKSQISY
jgi:hypothetical protein